MPRPHSDVMAGLGPAIHALLFVFCGSDNRLLMPQGVDARTKCGHDEIEGCTTAYWNRHDLIFATEPDNRAPSPAMRTRGFLRRVVGRAAQPQPCVSKAFAIQIKIALS